MIGMCFGGVVRLSQHPAADMHGLLRCVVRTKNWTEASKLLASYGVAIGGAWSRGIWQKSISIVEQQVSELHYGEVLGCQLGYAYLKTEFYSVFPKRLLISEQRKERKAKR